MGKASRRNRGSTKTAEDKSVVSTAPPTEEDEIIKSHTLHKQEFDRIRLSYKLDSPDKAEKISEMLASSDGGVSAPEFARMFGMSTTEAVVFLEWIKVGIKFKVVEHDVVTSFGLLLLA